MGILTDRVQVGPDIRDRQHARLLLEVADLVEVRQMKQKDVVNLLAESRPSERIDAARVSRLRKEARAQGVVEVSLHAPRHLGLEHELSRVLANFGIRDVFVTPPGAGKNERGLGLVGGAVVLQAIQLVAERKLRSGRPTTVRLSLSCGSTLHAVVQDLLERFRRDCPELRDVTLELFPAALYPGHVVDSIYPATLVTTMKLLGPAEAPFIRAEAASLPANFYEHPERERTRYLNKYGLRKIVEDAKSADIFVVGLGSSKDPAYQRLVTQLGLNPPKRTWSDYPLETAYVPMDREGRPYSLVEERLVGVGSSALVQAAREPDRFVIGVFGGEAKRELLVPAVCRGCLNALVIDETVADHALNDLRVRPRTTMRAASAATGAPAEFSYVG